ncbi:hypothetical protein SDC9_101384 [bioreactor metagenome]|uniref:NAD-specific glutamate dehydrogenase n=1 Tax=bioreactor metagenome TaxID=1076179 RepID=A0A645ANX0_9ZZZZ
MQLAHAGDNGLAGLFVGPGLEGGVLLRQLDQGHGHFLLAGLGLGFDGHADDGVGELHGLQNDRGLFIAQSIAGGRVLQAHGGFDIAGIDLFNILPVIGVHLQNAANALLLALGAVQHGGTGGQVTGIHPEEAQTAHIGVGHDLERQRGEGLFVAGLAVFFLVGLGVHALDGGNVQGRGHIVHNGVQQLLHALVFIGRAAGDGDHFVMHGGLADGRADLLRGDVLSGQIRLHNGLVHHRNGIHQLFTILLGTVQHVGGNLLHAHVLAQIVVVHIGVHLHQIDDALEGVFTSDGELDGNGIALQTLFNHPQNVVIIRAHDIHLIDVDHAGDLVGIRLTPHGLGLGLHAALGAQHRYGAVQHTQRTLHFHGEVHMARGIDDIDAGIRKLVLRPLPVASRGGGRDGDAALLLLLHPVHGGSAVMGLTDLVVHAGVEQNALGSSRLARVNVGHNADIAGVFKRVFSRHSLSP